MPLTYRPMREEDLPAVHDANLRAFEDLDRRQGDRVPAAAGARGSRYGALAPAAGHGPRRRLGGRARRSDRRRRARLSCARGCGASRCCSSTRPRRARAPGASCWHAPGRYGDGARGHVILSSTDPRAMRAYARLGLDMHPCVMASRHARGRHGAGRGARRRPGRPPAHGGGRPRGPRRGARRRHRDDARGGRTPARAARAGLRVLRRRRPRADVRGLRRGRRRASCCVPALARDRRGRRAGLRRVARRPGSSGRSRLPGGRSRAATPTRAACSPAATSGRSRPYLPSGAYL